MDFFVEIAVPRGQNTTALILTQFEDGACIVTQYPTLVAAYKSDIFIQLMLFIRQTSDEQH